MRHWVAIALTKREHEVPTLVMCVRVVDNEPEVPTLVMCGVCVSVGIY